MTPEQIKQIIKDKVDGVWEAAHEGSGHRYLHVESGKYLRSVTTKLGVLSKPHLIPWAIRCAIDWLMIDDRLERLRIPHWEDEMRTGCSLAHTDIRDKAGDTGGKTHQFAEQYLKVWIDSGTKPEDTSSFMAETMSDPRAVAGARSFIKICEEQDIIPLASEILVGHPKYSAGALDILCLWKGDLCLLDIKTSNSVDKNFRYQLSAYKYMFEFMTGLKIKKVKILWLSKDMDKYKIYNVLELASAWSTFKHICAVYDDVMSSKDKIVHDIKKARL